MTGRFTPLLSNTDWNEEWKELQKMRRAVDDAAFWDMRSKSFTTKDAPNAYVRRFLELAAIQPGETVFDMGCGTGALSIPLGEAGHKVVAADFSQGMLDTMAGELDARQIKTVFPKLMSWSDDWPAFGVRAGMVDVALASRSIATADLRDSLMRLTEVARRRVCITLSTGSSPRMDERVLREIGVENVLGHDYLYAFNILVHEGLKPEVSYIESTRSDTYGSRDEAFKDFSRMVNDALADPDEAELDTALAHLRSWIDVHVIENPDTGKPDRKGLPQKPFTLDTARTVTWAFLAWNN